VSAKPTAFTESLQQFIFTNAVRETEELVRLREETASHPMAMMQISPIQGMFMGVLIKALEAKRILEVGTFTGYSACVMARAAGPDGHVVTCDLSDEYTSVARRYWREAGLEDRIDLRLGNASDTLAGLLDQGLAESFDLAFIDADKEQYPVYYERALALVKPGGAVLIDNMFMDGRVAAPDNDEEGVLAVRELYQILESDSRVDYTVIPLADGLGMVVKR
jgi:caffeoyl-CoA O-methyltransferase